MRNSASRTFRPTNGSPTFFAVPVQAAAIEALRALSPVIARWGRWYLFGAQAVIAYGFPRLTADVDVTLALSPHMPEEFVRAMEHAGFAPQFRDPHFIKHTRVMPFVHLATGIPLDVVLAGAGLEEAFLDRAAVTDIGGLAVPVIGLADLIVTKILAGRPQDLTDASTLWRLHGRNLDAERIRAILLAVEEALGQSDLVRAFDAMAR
jgi:hypothetical protein